MSEWLPAWVSPSADRIRHARRDVVEFARSAPAGFWALPSPNEGWSNKDLLAHLATSHWVLQGLLASVLDRQPFVFNGPDIGNAERVVERRECSVEALVEEAEAEGAETDALLARLGPEHADYRREGAPRTLAETLAAFANHDSFHLDQLRAGLRAESNV